VALRPWFERRFSFEQLGEADFPFLLERLRGAPARVEDKTRALPREVLVRKPSGGGWSIQEQVGHLVDLDLLHDARIDDYREGHAVLRAADLLNRRTHDARHNERPVAELQAEFRSGRERYLARLQELGEGLALRSAIHPRLQQPMRLLDMLYFTAEHDDHHLAHMTELARQG
jgi:uncharacterized damage-inducible protein DinB